MGIEEQLKQLVNEPIRLTVTDNRSTLISYRKDPAGIRLRVHWMFQEADVHTVGALASFIKGSSKKQAGQVLDDYIEQNKGKIRVAGRNADSRANAGARGDVYDLQQIMDRLNRVYFGASSEKAAIVWGRRTRTKGRRSIRLGVYIVDDDLIRISPALDDYRVPLFFIEYIVFHEMLHSQFCRHSRAKAPWRHTPRFQEEERRFAWFRQARAWEVKHLDKVLSRPKRGARVFG